MSEDVNSWIRLASSRITALINPQGAQLSALRDDAAHDLLWNGDPAVWSGRAPILFPIVGALAGGAYRIGNATYVLPRHGFARTKPFEVIEANAAAALLRLSPDEGTRAVYPFEFELDIQFEVRESTIIVTALVRNNGDREMPASIGFHPAFRWPLPYGKAKSAHFIEFEVDEPAPVRRLNAQGLLTPTPHSSPVRGRRLALDNALFKDDALIFDGLRSRSVLYGCEDTVRIQVNFPDAPYLGIWSKPGDFICIEPWHGIADPEGYRGELSEKPGIVNVPPDATFEMRTEITMVALKA